MPKRQSADIQQVIDKGRKESRVSLLRNLLSLLLLAVHLPALLVMLLRGQDLSPGLARAFGLAPRRAGDRPCIWIHGASLGELQVLVKLLPLLQQQYPDWEIVVSTSSWSGWDLACRQLSRYQVILAPWDVPFAVRAAFDRVRPNVLAVVEFATQPNLIAEASARGVALTIINGRISRQHEKFCRRWSSIARKMLASFDEILVQNATDAERFIKQGAAAERIAIGGALKFDNARFERNNFESRRLARLAGIGPEDVVLLAGSTRRGEEEIVARVFRRLVDSFPHLKLIVTPRNADRFNAVARVLRRLGLTPARRTELDRANGSPSPRVVLVDTLGELPAWWGVAQIGFVGNSLTHRGGQNMIEPAAFGVATCFGPLTDNFQDVVELLVHEKAAVVVKNEADLEAFVRRCLTDGQYAAHLGSRAQAVVAQQTGVQQRTLKHLAGILENMPQPVIYQFPAARTAAQRREAA
jgi:3-deoxy-D-manno-octulosonic-acid transferase